MSATPVLPLLLQTECSQHVERCRPQRKVSNGDVISLKKRAFSSMFDQDVVDLPQAARVQKYTPDKIFVAVGWPT